MASHPGNGIITAKTVKSTDSGDRMPEFEAGLPRVLAI